MNPALFTGINPGQQRAFATFLGGYSVTAGYCNYLNGTTECTVKSFSGAACDGSTICAFYFTALSGYSTKVQFMYVKFKLNDPVVVVLDSGALNVRGTPSTTGTLLGSQGTGAEGTVTSGPTVAGGFVWWNINFASGADGWVTENYLYKINPSLSVALSAVHGGATAVKADVDDDGVITVTDGVLALRCAAQLPPCAPGAIDTTKQWTADVDCDGTVTVTDAVNILRKAVGLPASDQVNRCLAGRKSEVLGGYRLRVDTDPDICTATNPFTGDCSCPKGYHAAAFGSLRGAGSLLDTKKQFGEVLGTALPLIFFDVPTIPVPVTVAGVGTILPTVQDTAIFTVIPYVQVVAAAVVLAFTIYNEFADQPAPGSPGTVFMCVDDNHNSTFGFQGGYSIRLSNAEGTQTNDLTTHDYSCPVGTIRDEVAHVRTPGDNEGTVYACHNSNIQLTGVGMSSYGGIYQVRTDNSQCVQGNTLVSNVVDSGWSFVGPDGLGVHFISFRSQTDQAICACSLGYVPIPIATAATSNGNPSIVWLCQAPPIETSVPLPRSATSQGLIRVHSFDKTTLQGISVPVFIQNKGETPYRSIKETQANDYFSVFFNRLPPQRYYVGTVIPEGYRGKLFASICKPTVEGVCPTATTFSTIDEDTSKTYLGTSKARWVASYVGDGEVMDVYFAFQPI